MAEIPLHKKQVSQVKRLAKEIADHVQAYIEKHSTVSVERTILRLYGVDGVDSEGTPLPNRLVDILLEKGWLNSGVSRYFAAAMMETGRDANTTAELISQGKVEFGEVSKFSQVDIQEKKKNFPERLSQSLIVQGKESRKRLKIPSPKTTLEVYDRCYGQCL